MNCVVDSTTNFFVASCYDCTELIKNRRYAIAYATLEYLVAKRACVLFATHYHMLVEDYEQDSNVALYHMSCLQAG